MCDLQEVAVLDYHISYKGKISFLSNTAEELARFLIVFIVH